MTVYSWFEIQTQARQLRGKCAYLSVILPLKLPIRKIMQGGGLEHVTQEVVGNLVV